MFSLLTFWLHCKRNREMRELFACWLHAWLLHYCCSQLMSFRWHKNKYYHLFNTYFICFTMVLFPDSPAPVRAIKWLSATSLLRCVFLTLSGNTLWAANSRRMCFDNAVNLKVPSSQKRNHCCYFDLKRCLCVWIVSGWKTRHHMGKKNTTPFGLCNSKGERVCVRTTHLQFLFKETMMMLLKTIMTFTVFVPFSISVQIVANKTLMSL